MALLDLAVFFGSTTTQARSLKRVLTVDDDELYFGFIIDESLGMQHFPQEAFEEEIKVEAMFQPFVKGGYRVGTTEWPILSLAALAADPDLEKLAR